MSLTHPSKDCELGAPDRILSGPRLAFLGAMVAIGATIASDVLPDPLLMPTLAMLLFVLAMMFALIAWIRCSTDEYGVTYWDVAGAVALIGICTAALVEPEQLVRLVESN